MSHPPTDPIADARLAARAAVADPDRIAALRDTGLLDHATEPAFERLTRLAARLLRAPAAFVSLVDAARDVYVSAVGLPEPLATDRQLLGETFCHFTLAEGTADAPLVIPDTAAHPVFRDVPTVASLGVAAYVGVPLVVGGHSLGALCVIDVAPREWTPSEVEVLGELAESARRELEMRAALTAARRAETALRQSEERYALAARATSNAIWDWDLTTDGLAWSVGVHEVFGYAPGAPSDDIAWWSQAIHPDDRARVLDGIHAAVARADRAPGDPHVWSDEYRFRRGDGSYATVVDRGYVARDASGRATRMIGAMADVSAERAAAAERERLLAAERSARGEAEAARREAERANHAKSIFLATMSHELRTPINAMIGYAQLLDLGIAGPLTDQQRSYLARLAASSEHLLGLVNDVLDLSKIEAGETRVTLRDARTGDETRAALDVVAPAASVRDVHLVDACDEGGIAYVGDEARVRQILVNLLSNAVRFTPAGGTITMACEQTSRSPGSGRLDGGGPWAVVRVEDTGIGIPPEEQERIFEPFHQVDREHTRQRRHGAGPRDQPPARAADGRRPDGPEHAGRGLDLQPVAAGRAPWTRDAERPARPRGRTARAGLGPRAGARAPGGRRGAPRPGGCHPRGVRESAAGGARPPARAAGPPQRAGGPSGLAPHGPRADAGHRRGGERRGRAAESRCRRR